MYLIEFYSNLSIVGTFLRSTTKEAKIDIHKDHFGRMFELPFQGTSYTYKAPLGSKNFKHSIVVNSLVMNPMEKRKLSIMAIFMKPRVCVFHYLLIRILLQRRANLNFVITNDIVHLWLLTKKFQTN